MAAGGGGGGGGGVEGPRQLDQTPTWAVSTVCGVIILISIILELMIHKVGEVISYTTYILFFSSVIIINFSLHFHARRFSSERRRKPCMKLLRRLKMVLYIFPGLRRIAL